MQDQPIPVAAHAPALLRKIPRAVWIGGGIAAVVLLALLCGGAAAALSLLLGFGRAAPGAGIVGKWEVVGGPAWTVEFKSDGTGTLEMPGSPFAVVRPDQAPKVAANQVPERCPFTWRIDPEKTPVLVTDPDVDFKGVARGRHTMAGPLLIFGPPRSHCHFQATL